MVSSIINVTAQLAIMKEYRKLWNTGNGGREVGVVMINSGYNNIVDQSQKKAPRSHASGTFNLNFEFRC